MDAIHRPSHRAWIDDNVVNVKGFVEQWSNALSFRDSILPGNSSLEATVSINEFRDIENQCG